MGDLMDKKIEIIAVLFSITTIVLYMPPYDPIIDFLLKNSLIHLYLLFPALSSIIFICLSRREIGVLRKFCSMVAVTTAAVVAVEDLLYVIMNNIYVLKLFCSDYFWIGMFAPFYLWYISELKPRTAKFWIALLVICNMASGILIISYREFIPYITIFSTVIFSLKLVLNAPWLYLLYKIPYLLLIFGQRLDNEGLI